MPNKKKDQQTYISVLMWKLSQHFSQHLKKQLTDRVQSFLQESKESEVVQSCPTLCDPWTIAHQAPPSMGFSRQEYWSGLPFPSPNPKERQCQRMFRLWYSCTHLTHQQSQFSSVKSLSHVRLFVNPWTAVCQACLSIMNSWSLLKLMSIESVMPSNHLILCHPLLLSPSVIPSTRVFSNESVLCIRWPK